MFCRLIRSEGFVLIFPYFLYYCTWTICNICMYVIYIYVCMYVCLYVCNICMCVCVCIYVCMYVIYVCLCIYVRMYVIYLCVYICVYVCMYVCMYVCQFSVFMTPLIVNMCCASQCITESKFAITQ